MKPEELDHMSASEADNEICLTVLPFSEKFSSVYEAISQAIQSKDFKLSHSRVDTLYSSNRNSDQFLQEFSRSEIIISDVSTWNHDSFKEKEKVLILTKSMEDIPLGLKKHRCLEYRHTDSGLRQLTTDLKETLLDLAPTAKRFTVKKGTPYRFPHRIHGSNKSLFEFEITFVQYEDEIGHFEISLFQIQNQSRRLKIHKVDSRLKINRSINLPGISSRLMLKSIQDSGATFVMTSNA